LTHDDSEKICGDQLIMGRYVSISRVAGSIPTQCRFSFGFGAPNIAQPKIKKATLPPPKGESTHLTTASFFTTTQLLAAAQFSRTALRYRSIAAQKR
jgi:hypothetical protein